MNEFLVNDWLDALTSGDYEQTDGMLCYVDSDGKAKFCCLGVATDLFIKAGGEVAEIKLTDFTNGGAKRVYNGEGNELLIQVREWMGVPSADPRMAIRNINFDPTKPTEYLEDYGNNVRHLLNETLSELNDGGLTFEQIADVIRYVGLPRGEG